MLQQVLNSDVKEDALDGIVGKKARSEDKDLIVSACQCQIKSKASRGELKVLGILQISKRFCHRKIRQCGFEGYWPVNNTMPLHHL